MIVDLEDDYDAPMDALQQNKAKLLDTIHKVGKMTDSFIKTNIILIHPLRPGKKLVVFDLDYTLFDCKSPASHISELARPGMHELLVVNYTYSNLLDHGLSTL